ncbi:MAG TPA: methionyl-tRNA formyltransferase [candidate division Zixibacteria bacterium]|nr:methionyl-tRNA formyltransferase [candidate division Zixibacteria bacterium]
MRLVFLGTPNFASQCLEKILSKHQVAAVVTAPDKPKGRGMKVEPSEVKLLAQERGLDILQPINLKDSEFLKKLSFYKADLFCVVAFRILPEEVFTMPPKGCINLHGSLLPKYRGAAPINWAIINGERETGLTTFFIRRAVDTGDIILQEKILIGPEETFGELYERMAELGGETLIKTIDLIETNSVSLSSQDNNQATPAPKLTPEIGKIDWIMKAEAVHNLVRGLSPKPGAYSFLKGKKVIVLRTRLTRLDSVGKRPGEVLQADPQKGIIIACGEGSVEILELKPESGKAITGAEFVRGHRLIAGEVFEQRIGN